MNFDLLQDHDFGAWPEPSLELPRESLTAEFDGR